MNELKHDKLELLRKPFSDNQISLLPKPFKKDSIKGNCKECGGYHGLPAAHLKYVGHAALTDRLLEVDPLWIWEPLALDEFGLPRFDKNGGLWIKLTVCGHTRLGYGSAESSTYKDIGSREKEVIGDALRNAAMRFGAALDLWHKGDLHQIDDTDTSTKKIENIVIPKVQDVNQAISDKKIVEVMQSNYQATQSVNSDFDSFTPPPVDHYNQAETLPADNGDYVCKIGKKHIGKTLNEMGVETVRGFADWIIKGDQEKGIQSQGDWAEFLTQAEIFCKGKI